MAKITTQEQIAAREAKDAATFQKRAQVALKALGSWHYAAADGRAYVRHAARNRDQEWYMSALRRQANTIGGAA